MLKAGQRIIALRKEKGITQLKLSESIGIPQSTLSQYEQGKREIGAECLLSIARFFGVCIEYVMGVTDFKMCNEEFYNKFDKLTPEGKNAINSVIEVMINK